MKKITKSLFGKVDLANIDSSQRNNNVNVQMLLSLLIKAISFIITFLQVPMLLRYLGNDAYGVWITIFSVVSWISIADIGIGAGLRNKLAMCLAKNEIDEGRSYVSTAYISILTIAAVLIVLSFIIIPFINWQSFFNIHQVANRVLMITVLTVTITTLLGFVLSLINQILMAIQLNSYSSIPFVISNLLFMFVLYIVSYYVNINIIYVAIIYSITFLLTFISTTIVFFKYHQNLIPKRSLFNKAKVSGIFSLGFSFFVIQIAGIIFFSTDNYIIARIFGPGEVSVYNITLKVFSGINMVFTLALNPLWSAYTEAYEKKDFKWIKKKVSLFSFLVFPIMLVALVIAYFFDDILHVWLHKSIKVPLYLPYFMALFTIVSVWNNIYGYVLGGIGKVKLGAYSSILMAILNIPLCYIFSVNMHMGVVGIITATIVCMGISSILSPLQVYHFIYVEKRNMKWDKYLS